MNKTQIIGNAGVNYVAWQLSRRGWNVMQTIRNARGSDLIVTNEDESLFFGVQSKAISRRYSIPLGLALDSIRSDWWVITLFPNSEQPVCYVMSQQDVRELAKQDKGGKQSFWLDPPAFDREEFKEAWARMGSPQTTTGAFAPVEGEDAGP